MKIEKLKNLLKEIEIEGIKDVWGDKRTFRVKTKNKDCIKKEYDNLKKISEIKLAGRGGALL